MSFTLDPEVAEALAPFAAEAAGSTPPPVGDVRSRSRTSTRRWSGRTRLGRAGVPVEFHLHPGVPHEFDFVAFDTSVARRVIADRVRALASL